MKFLTSEKLKQYLLCGSAVALNLFLALALFVLSRGVELSNLSLA